MQGAVREIAFEIVRADGSAAAGARQLGRCAPTPTGEPRVDPHDGLRRDRPPALRAGAAARARARARLALELQRSLLAGALPDGRRAGARRRLPAGRARASRSAATGTTRSGSTSRASSRVVVGDVVGRGHRAPPRRWASCAARSARWPPPASARRALLEALDALRRRHAVGQMTTLAYARARPRDAARCATRAPATRRRRS